MRIFTTVFISFFFLLPVCVSAKAENGTLGGNNAGISFIENKGQWVPEAKYKASVPGGALFITNNGFVYNYAKESDLERVHELMDKGDRSWEKAMVQLHAYKVQFLGANSSITYSPTGKSSAYNNYFIGNDPARWATHVALYGKILQQNIYDGIDVAVYSKNNSLKYDFIVAPGADPSKIVLAFDGVNPDLTKDGDLHIKTSVNELFEKAPYVYQEINGEEIAVAARYKLIQNHLSFDFPNGYDTAYPLIIDPVLVFCTYSGSTGTSGYYSYTTTYDNAGNAYAGCQAYGPGWPTTTGVIQANFVSLQDVGINKYNATGTNLVYSTYYGGSGVDLPHALRVNDQEELVVVGSTTSSDLPHSTGCYDSILNSTDMFVAHFNTTGTILLGATYMGGNGTEPIAFSMTGPLTGGLSGYNSSPLELNFDHSGNIWVVGNTQSADFPVVTTDPKNSYTQNAVICPGNTFTFGSQLLTTAGDYEQTFTTPSGCDSLVKLHLELAQPFTDTIFERICPGTNYLFGSNSLSSAGTYTDTFTAATGGCDSIVTLKLALKPYIRDSIWQNMCTGSTFSFGGQILSHGGTYIDTFSTAGCDSIVYLKLAAEPYERDTFSVQICSGGSYSFGGQTLTSGGAYTDTFSSAGCDSISTILLSVSPPLPDTLNETFCTGSDYIFGTNTLTAAGTYSDTFTTPLGCKQLVTLLLTQGSQNTYSRFESICPGDSYAFGNETLTSGGTYTDTFATSSCDSIVTLHLSVRPYIMHSMNVNICRGSSYTFGSQVLTASGTYTDTFAASGCDSIVIIHLFVPAHKNEGAYNRRICPGASLSFGSQILTGSGTYTEVFSTDHCDSTVTLHLRVDYIRDTQYVDICPGEVFQLGNQVYNTTGTYIDTFSTSGCDSIVTAYLTAHDFIRDTVSETICTGGTYYFGTQTITAPGTYTEAFPTSGCDSVVTLNLSGAWASQDTLNGNMDGILFQLDPTCSNLLFSKYIGGSGTEALSSLVFNKEGNIVLCGITTSNDFPTTDSSFHPDFLGGSTDGLISVINPAYGTMLYSTYVGTNNADYPISLQVDDSSHIYVMSRTSGSYPVSPGVYSITNGNVFIDKLTPTLSNSLLSTTVGGGGYVPDGFLLDICRNVYVTGLSASGGLPTTQNAFETNPRPFWFCVLEPNFSGLLYGSYFGVSGDHTHVGVSRLDPQGIVYHSICNNSQYPFTTTGGWSPNYTGSGQDIVTFKFDFEASGVHSEFELDPVNNDTGCAPYSVNFINNSTQAASYLWDFGDNTTSMATSPTHIFQDPGVYTVVLHAHNDATCITDDVDSMVIVVLKTDMPDITVSDTTVCKGAFSLDIGVTINNPTPNNRIAWGPPLGILTANDQPVITVDPSLNETYYVIVKDTIPGICGFSTTDTVHIDYAPRGIDIITNDTVVCEGSQVQVVASSNPDYTYVWAPATGIDNPNALNPVITVNQPETYTLTASHKGCPDTSLALSIDMHYMPQVSLGPDIAVCQWTQVALQSHVTPFRNDYIYQWVPSGGLQNPTAPDAAYIADTSGMYTLNVQTPIGCTGSDSMYVTVYPGGFGGVSTDTGYCPPNEVPLRATGGKTYLWDPAYGLDDPTSDAPFASPETSTDYTVYITDEHGCLDTERVSVQVYPLAVITIPDSISIYPGEAYHLEPGTNCLYFNWFPTNGISSSHIADPIFNPAVRTRYFVTARTEHGCDVTDSIDILVHETIIDLPNAFTPGQGANSVFSISKRGIARLKSFSIYNRWGNKVFSTTNIDEGWDGKFNGTPQPMGTYIYVIDAVTDTGRPFNQKGDVTLIR